MIWTVPAWVFGDEEIEYTRWANGRSSPRSLGCDRQRRVDVEDVEHVAPPQPGIEGFVVPGRREVGQLGVAGAGRDVTTRYFDGMAIS